MARGLREGWRRGGQEQEDACWAGMAAASSEEGGVGEDGHRPLGVHLRTQGEDLQQEDLWRGRGRGRRGADRSKRAFDGRGGGGSGVRR